MAFATFNATQEVPRVAAIEHRFHRTRRELPHPSFDSCIDNFSGPQVMPRACSAALLAKIAWRHVGGPTTGRMPIPASLAMVERGEAATEAAIRELDTCAASKASTATALKLQARRRARNNRSFRPTGSLGRGESFQRSSDRMNVPFREVGESYGRSVSGRLAQTTIRVLGQVTRSQKSAVRMPVSPERPIQPSSTRRISANDIRDASSRTYAGAIVS